LKLLSAIECILILDHTVRLVEEDDSTYLVPDSDKIIARANRYRQDIRCGNSRRICVSTVTVICIDFYIILLLAW
jgi:hypothetical protein